MELSVQTLPAGIFRNMKACPEQAPDIETAETFDSIEISIVCPQNKTGGQKHEGIKPMGRVAMSSKRIHNILKRVSTLGKKNKKRKEVGQEQKVSAARKFIKRLSAGKRSKTQKVETKKFGGVNTVASEDHFAEEESKTKLKTNKQVAFQDQTTVSETNTPNDKETSVVRAGVPEALQEEAEDNKVASIAMPEVALPDSVFLDTEEYVESNGAGVPEELQEEAGDDYVASIAMPEVALPDSNFLDTEEYAASDGEEKSDTDKAIPREQSEVLDLREYVESEGVEEYETDEDIPEDQLLERAPFHNESADFLGLAMVGFLTVLMSSPLLHT